MKKGSALQVGTGIECSKYLVLYQVLVLQCIVGTTVAGAVTTRY